MRAPVVIGDRILAAGVGCLLTIIAIVVTGVWGDSGLAVVFGVGGVAMLLFAVAGDRIKSVGPKGVVFRKLTEEIANHYGSRPVKAKTTLTNADQTEATGASDAKARAAAAIRAAETPEELLGTLRALNAVEADRDGD